MKRFIPALVVIALLGAGWFLWPKSVSDRELRTDQQQQTEESAEEIDRFLGLEPVVPDTQQGGVWPDDERNGSDLTKVERDAWRARRNARREHWKNATLEERKRWAERRVSVEPLGEAAPELEALDVLEAMRELRPQIRDCVRSNGGFRALREAMRSSDAGPRGGLTVAFELSSEGAVNGGSLTINPTPPTPYYQCFEQALGKLDAPVPGGDGAAIEIRMGRNGRRPRVPQSGSSTNSETSVAPKD